MTETLREISRITKRGNPRRIPLVIHHAGTGRAGIQKTTGYDRSSFGRNSKVLFSWARSQINVAPALPDSNDLIIIASAKCSNSREFKPFAAHLDQDTMLYQRLDDFDFDEWLPLGVLLLTTNSPFQDSLIALGIVFDCRMVTGESKMDRFSETIPQSQQGNRAPAFRR